MLHTNSEAANELSTVSSVQRLGNDRREMEAQRDKRRANGIDEVKLQRFSSDFDSLSDLDRSSEQKHYSHSLEEALYCVRVTVRLLAEHLDNRQFPILSPKTLAQRRHPAERHSDTIQSRHHRPSNHTCLGPQHVCHFALLTVVAVDFIRRQWQSSVDLRDSGQTRRRVSKQQLRINTPTSST